MAVTPLRSNGSLANEAAAQIKSLILSEGLRPGDPLPSEQELCERFGISRSSLREALKRLGTLEIVSVQHGRGTFVGDMSLTPLVETLAFRSVITPGAELAALKQVVEVRESLDVSMVDKVVGHFRDNPDQRLRQLVEMMNRKAGAGESFAVEDREFHARLWELPGCTFVSQLVAAFWDVHTAVLPQLSIPTPSDIEVTARAHARILRAAEAGDEAEYVAAVEEHYGPLHRVIAEAGAGKRQA